MNLAEQHGKEAQVTTAFGDYVAELGMKDVRSVSAVSLVLNASLRPRRYHAYDFHAETRGMK